jgi:hypothetical protein
MYTMAFFCHPEPDNAFTCQSSFTPYVPPEEKISMQDHIPEAVKEAKKKDGGITYLPGERLLIQIGKQKPKVDVDRISKSLSRVLRLV